MRMHAQKGCNEYHSAKQAFTKQVAKQVLDSIVLPVMLCAPINHWRPFSYHMKMADIEYFRVLSVFSWKKLA